jgi:hypothetical protein
MLVVCLILAACTPGGTPKPNPPSSAAAAAVAVEDGCTPAQRHRVDPAPAWWRALVTVCSSDNGKSMTLTNESSAIVVVWPDVVASWTVHRPTADPVRTALMRAAFSEAADQRTTHVDDSGRRVTSARLVPGATVTVDSMVALRLNFDFDAATSVTAYSTTLLSAWITKRLSRTPPAYSLIAAGAQCAAGANDAFTAAQNRNWQAALGYAVENYPNCRTFVNELFQRPPPQRAAGNELRTIIAEKTSSVWDTVLEKAGQVIRGVHY